MLRVRERLLGVAGVTVVLGAMVWAFAGAPTVPVVTLVAIGLVLAGADAAIWRATGNDGSDLDVPAGRRLDPPPWGVLVVIAAASGLLAAVLVGAPLVAVGTGLLLVATIAGLLRRPAESSIPARTVFTARRLRAFARAHGVQSGQPAQGYLTPVGQSGARLLVIAPDGAWADVMVGRDATAVAGLARIELCEPNDPATGQRLRIGPGLWARMTDSW